MTHASQKHPRMRVGNNFSRVCLCVFCLSVQALAFELLKLGTTFLVCRCIYFYLTVTSVCLYSTKTYLKGQGHVKVKVKVTHYQDQVK